MHGYEIIQEIEARSAGVWKPSPGSVYPTLQLLEDTGLVTAAEIDGRRVFSLTETGRTEAEQRQDTAPPWAELAEDAGRPDQRLRKSISPVATAVHELFHHGTQAQQEQARVILNDTRKRLYMLLAEGDEEDAGTHLG
jgi:DNA-binding PadR family transcriptional regulator